MRRIDIINALVAQGYQAEAKETVKNGIVFEGIIIRSNDIIAPIIYTEQLLRDAEEKGKRLSDVVIDIIRMYEESQHKKNSIEKLINRNHFLNNVFIGLQKISEEQLVKEPTEYDGIEAYLYVRGTKDVAEGYSVKVTQEYLQHTDVDIKEAWKAARENTFAETELKCMSTVMADICGLQEEEVLKIDNEPYIVSNQCKIKGASAILNQDMLRRFAQRNGVSQLVVLPSSIHEMIVIPFDTSIDMGAMSEMVREINATQVSPEDRLTDRAYLIDVK